MDLEEIKQMSDEELGQRLAIEIGVYYQDGFSYITDGKYPHPDRDMSTLCRSLDAVSEVEKIVIEKVETAAYAESLMKVLGKWHESNTFRLFKAIILMTARQRAAACLLALKAD